MTSSISLRRLAGLLSLVSVLSGCGTLKTKGNSEWGHTYSGTACAVETAKWVHRDEWALTPFAWPDVLLSSIADTIVSPFDLLSSTHPAHQNCDTADAESLQACVFKADPAAASVLAGARKDAGRLLEFVVVGTDAAPRKFSASGNCDDVAVRAAPGEREFSVQAVFINRGLRNFMSRKAGPFFADVKLKAAVEAGKTYRLNGEIRDKSAFAWIEDAATGQKISAEAGAAYSETRPLSPSSGFLVGLAGIILR